MIAMSLKFSGLMVKFVQLKNKVMGIFSDLFDAFLGNSQPVDELAGTTEDTATPLKRVLPLFCTYDDLELDIKYNLDHTDSNRVYNYRTYKMGIIEYEIIVSTNIDRETNFCMVDYTMITSSSFAIFYNLYETLDFLLPQIREKRDGVFIYHTTKEVRQKVPTFCVLLSNAEKNDKKPTYGLPFISFLDVERKYPLLYAFFNDEALKKEGDMDKLHISLLKIVLQLATEVSKADILTQTKKTMFKNLTKMIRMFILLN